MIGLNYQLSDQAILRYGAFRIIRGTVDTNPYGL